MAHRGTQALGEKQWQVDQYALGVAHGKAGRQALYSDQFYQRGYRRGTARRAKLENPKPK